LCRVSIDAGLSRRVLPAGAPRDAGRPGCGAAV